VSSSVVICPDSFSPTVRVIVAVNVLPCNDHLAVVFKRSAARQSTRACAVAAFRHLQLPVCATGNAEVDRQRARARVAVMR